MVTTAAAKSSHLHNVRRDDRFRCLNPDCLCEIKISREPFIGVQMTRNLRCCCGSAMERVS
jgi:hypothetical protein